MIYAMDDITQEQMKVIDELKRTTINEVTPKMLEDVSLFYRFAKARDFNLVEAETMLRNHIAWRKAMQIDTILTDYEPPEVLDKYIPTTFLCFDKDGSVVRINDAGHMDLKGLWNVAKKTELAKHVVFIMEQDKERVIKQGRNLGKPLYSVIYDFENFSYANAVSVKTLHFVLYIMKMFVDNYPETINRAIVINAPIYFAWLYAAIKPIIPDTIIQKVRIYGTDGWRDCLLDFVDAEDLPAYLGGNKTDPDGNPLCETFIKHGRLVPRSYYRSKRGKKLCLDPDVEKLTVMPLSKEEITFDVKEENSYLEWEFETKNRDIYFSLLFKRESPEDTEHVVFIPKQRMDTSDESEKGCFKCEKVGNCFEPVELILQQRGVFWYPRLGLETSLFSLLMCGKSDVNQPNRGYQNRPQRMDICYEPDRGCFKCKKWATIQLYSITPSAGFTRKKYITKLEYKVQGIRMFTMRYDINLRQFWINFFKNTV